MRQNNTTARHTKSAIGLLLAITMLTGTSPKRSETDRGSIELEMYQPTEDGVYYSDTPITFAAHVETYGEDDHVMMHWHSDLMDMSWDIPTNSDGTVLHTETLDEGEHTITVMAMDEALGYAHELSVLIYVSAPQPSDTANPEDTGSEGGDGESDDGGATDDTGTAD